MASQDQIASRPLEKAPDIEDVSREFLALADWLDEEVAKGHNHQGIPEVVVLTDLAGYGPVSWSDLNPVARHGWSAVLGMLVLAFPECHWVLVAGDIAPETHAVLRASDGTEIYCDLRLGCRPEQLTQVLRLNNAGYTPLFDAGGIRHKIRTALATELDEKRRVQVPLRNEMAAAIDEEHGYTFLNAYTAYRFGFRSHVICTMGGMNAFLKYPVLPQPALVFEDLFLHFPDGHPDNFSNLQERDISFKLFARAQCRILITSGHHHGQDELAKRDNPSYLRGLRDNGQWNHVLTKPLGGIFNLWDKAGLFERLHSGGHLGLAPGFTWPLDALNSHGRGHSAPGRLLVVADRLIARAERLFKEVDSVPKAVFGAVMVTDAMELLGGKTPTTSLEALALRHQFEVLAECQFMGMQEHVDVRSRIVDLSREVKALSNWFGETKQERKVAGWNMELAVIDKLIEVFRDNNQYDEEQELQICARMLHRKLWIQARPWFKPVEWVPWYVEKLLASVSVFLMALVGWIAILGLLFWLVGGVTVGCAYSDAFVTFFGLQPPGDNSFWTVENGWNGAFALIACTMLLGCVHVGILISHLYSSIARK